MSDQSATVYTDGKSSHSRSAALDVSVYEIDEAFFAHVSSAYWAWRALADRGLLSSVLQHPACVLAELKATQQAPVLPAVFILARSGSDPLGAAILIPHAAAGAGQRGLAKRLRGYLLVGSGLPGAADVTARTMLMQRLSSHMASVRADYVLMEDVSTAEPLIQISELKEHGLVAYRPSPAQEHHWIDLPQSLDEYMQQFNGKTRNTLRRKVRRLGECRLQKITTADEVPSFLTAAHRISQQSWQRDLLGLRVRNDDRELEVLTHLAGMKALRAYLLWSEDRPVSFCMGTQYQGVFSYEEVAYDRSFASRSPGQVLVLKMIQDLIEHDRAEVFDFGAGHAEYKRQFANRQTVSGPVWLLRSGWRGSAVRGWLSGRRLLSSALRGTLRRLGLMERLRQLSRRGISPPRQS